MVSKKEADWPPAGWKVETKISNGRKVKCYINSKTHQKFYSKLAVLRYIKDGRVSNKRSQATCKQAMKNSGKKEMKLAEANDHSEWLPPGWTIEWRTRQSGSREGEKYKCFIDPSTGRKFFSRPEVSQYLKSIQGSAGSSRQKERGSRRQSSSNRSADPLRAHTSNLEPNVSQVSKTCLRKSTSSRKIKVVFERTIDEDLPSGWIKEMRVKYIGSQVARRDPFYVDPATGLVFQSKVDAVRYVKTGEVSRHAYRRRNGSINKEKLAIEETPPTSPDKRQKTAKDPTRKQLLTGEGSPKEIIPALPEVGIKEVGIRKSQRLSSTLRSASVDEASLEQSTLSESSNTALEMLAKPSTKNSAATEETERMTERTLQEVRDANGKENNASLRENESSSAPSRGVFLEGRPEDAALRACSNAKAQTSKRKTKDRKPSNLPSRSSKRLAGVDAEIVFHSIPIEHALRSTNKKSGKAKAIPSLGSIPDEPPEKHRPLTADTQNALSTAEESSNKSNSFTHENPRNPEIDLLMVQAPPGFSKEQKIEVSSIKVDQSSEYPRDCPIPEVQPDTLPGSKIEKSPGDCPTLEVQPSGAEKVSEQPEPQVSFPLPLWSDPCLEFAYKTLTGAIPLDDNLAIEDYIQHQLRTSPKQSNNNWSLPDNSVPSVFQSDVSSQFNTSRQQQGTKPVSPLSEEVIFPNTTGIGSHKPSR